MRREEKKNKIFYLHHSIIFWMCKMVCTSCQSNWLHSNPVGMERRVDVSLTLCCFCACKLDAAFLNLIPVDGSLVVGDINTAKVRCGVGVGWCGVGGCSGRSGECDTEEKCDDGECLSQHLLRTRSNKERKDEKMLDDKNKKSGQSGWVDVFFKRERIRVERLNNE